MNKTVLMAPNIQKTVEKAYSVLLKKYKEAMTMSETIYEQLQQLQMLMQRAAFDHFGNAHNVHRGKGWVLALLNIKPEINQKELTCLLNMSKQAAEELINELEKSGYIMREPSVEDKQVMTIRLTEEGAKATSNVDDITSRIFKVFDCLNDDEQAMFSEFLERIIKRQAEQFSNENFEPCRQMMKDFMLNDELGMGGHRAFPGFVFHPGMIGFNPGMKSFNPGMIGFNLDMMNPHSFMSSPCHCHGHKQGC